MAEAALKIERTTQSRTLLIRGPNSVSHLLLGATGAYFILLAFLAPLSILKDGKTIEIGSYFLSEGIFYLVPAALFFYLFYHSLRASVPFSRVDVNSEGYRVEGHNFSQEIRFADVVGVEIQNRPLVFSSIKFYLNDESSHQVPQFLERSDYLINAFTHARPEFAEKLNHYHLGSVLADHRMARWVGKTRFFLARTLLLAPVLVVGGYLYMYESNSPAADLYRGNPNIMLIDWMRLISTDFLLLVVADLFLNLWTLRSLKMNPHQVVRNTRLETMVFRLAFAGFLVAAIWPYLRGFGL